MLGPDAPVMGAGRMPAAGEPGARQPEQYAPDPGSLQIRCGAIRRARVLPPFLQ